MNVEIDKMESELEVAEANLEAALEELDTVKSSEAKALGDLKNVINTAIEARGKSGGAAELADKKIAAAQAWVEALKAHEKEILMKVEMTQREISELSEDEYEIVDEPELMAKVVASPRRTVKRAKLHRLRTSMTRYSVLYILPGLSSKTQVWWKLSCLLEAARQSLACIRLCLVCPGCLLGEAYVCDIRTSYVSRQCTISDGDNAAPCLPRGLAVLDWLVLAS
ncbi:hypothetical protein Tco_1219182, partial [Tanacetum coccineum]